jgi:hypothetical protein
MAFADVPWAIRMSSAVRIGVQRERELDCEGEEIEFIQMRAAGDRLEASRVDDSGGQGVTWSNCLNSGATARAYRNTTALQELEQLEPRSIHGGPEDSR